MTKFSPREKQRNYMLTTLYLDTVYIIKMLLLAFEEVHGCMTTCTTTAVAKPGQQQLPDQPYWITEKLCNKDEFPATPNMPGHTEFVSTCKGFRNIWEEGYHVLHPDLTFSVVLSIILFHCSAFPMVWTDGLILSEMLVLRFCQRFWGDTWQQFTHV